MTRLRRERSEGAYPLLSQLATRAYRCERDIDLVKMKRHLCSSMPRTLGNQRGTTLVRHDRDKVRSEFAHVRTRICFVSVSL
jgi:hypothetical protein